MSNVRINNISVPRTARNKRIYQGNSGTSTTKLGSESTVIDWVSVSKDDLIINRHLTIEGDLTIQNLSGLAGDTVIVNENGTLATVREVFNEIPSGLINGLNVDFTLSYLPTGSISLYKNGLKLKLSDDYTIIGKNITLVSPLLSDGYEDIILCDYRYVTYSPGGTPTPAIPDQISWMTMNRGVATEFSGFDIQICRVGKSITITGSFKFLNGSGVDSVIATIDSSIIAEGLTLSRRIYSQINEISSNNVNRGISIYVDTFDPISNPFIRIRARDAYNASDVAYFSVTFNVI